MEGADMHGGLDTAGIDAFLDDAYRQGTVRTESGSERPIFPEGLRRRQGEELSDLVEAERAVRTIETGCAVGLSGLYIVRGALRGGAESPEHVAMDPHQTREFGGAGRQSFADAGVASTLTFEERGSEVVLPELLSAGRGRFDFGFVDGAHFFEFALLDLFYMTRLVRPGGLIAVDDVWMPSVRAAVEYYITNAGLELERPYRHRTRRRFRAGLRREYRFDAMAVLRLPDSPRHRPWYDFTPFRVEGPGVPPDGEPT